MPARSSSLTDSSWILALAAWTASASRCSTDPPSGAIWPGIISTAVPEATSPAWAPPIPSATMKSGARAWKASSFTRR